MNLPELRYACVRCGWGCRTFDVEITAAEARRILALAGGGRVEQRNERHWLRRDGCGHCTFLLPNQSCGLHAEHGFLSKPQRCRDYPFRARSGPGGVFVGVTFTCTAVLEEHGPLISEGAVEVPVREMPAVPLAAGVPFELETYLRWEGSLLQAVREPGEEGLEATVLRLGGEVGPLGSSQAWSHARGVLFRSSLALMEGPWTDEQGEARLDGLLTAVAEGGVYSSRILEGEVDVAALSARWQTPWSLWRVPLRERFFEHLLFRKYLLEGPDVISRVASLPTLVELLQFLCLARAAATEQSQPGEAELRWALRQLEQRLTFHARGTEHFMSHFGEALRGEFSL